VNACAPSSAIWRSCALAQANSSTAARSAGMTAWPLCAGADAFPASMSTSGVSSRCSRCSRARSRATGRLLVDLAPLPRVRATTPIEDIWCEKISGCSYRGGSYAY
jgi:hypothetical protein